MDSDEGDPFGDIDMSNLPEGLDDVDDDLDWARLDEEDALPVQPTVFPTTKVAATVVPPKASAMPFAAPAPEQASAAPASQVKQQQGVSPAVPVSPGKQAVHTSKARDAAGTTLAPSASDTSPSDMNMAGLAATLFAGNAATPQAQIQSVPKSAMVASEPANSSAAITRAPALTSPAPAPSNASTAGGDSAPVVSAKTSEAASRVKAKPNMKAAASAEVDRDAATGTSTSPLATPKASPSATKAKVPKLASPAGSIAAAAPSPTSVVTQPPAIISAPASHTMDAAGTANSAKLQSLFTEIEAVADDDNSAASAPAARRSGDSDTAKGSTFSGGGWGSLLGGAVGGGSSGDAGGGDGAQSKGWGFGSGAGWGLGLAAKLKDVAVGAVREVTDLTESFTQALADVADDDVEEGGDARRSARPVQPAPSSSPPPAHTATGESQVAGHGATLAVPEPGEAARAFAVKAPGAAAHTAPEVGVPGDGEVMDGEESEENAMRKQVLLRLTGQASDTQLEMGLKAIDDQVEQLATAGAKAVTSLWGGLRNVGAVLASRVDAAAKNIAAELAEGGGLENISIAAMSLLDGSEPSGSGRAGVREQPLPPPDGSSEPSTFDDFFYIYGGQHIVEEVSDMSNECSRLCNKSRAKLEAGQQELLDSTLTALGPYFDDVALGARDQSLLAASVKGEAAAASSTTDTTATPASPAAQLSLLSMAQSSTSEALRADPACEQTLQALTLAYEPIAYLCEDSVGRANAFAQQLQDSMQAVVQATAPSHVEANIADEPTSSIQESAGSETLDSAVGAAAQPPSYPAVVLSSLEVHSAKRVAEICTAQVQLLLQFGASIAAPARQGRVDDSIPWPYDQYQQAALLRHEAARMVSDLRNVTACYSNTVHKFISTLGAAAAATAAPTSPTHAADAAQPDAALDAAPEASDPVEAGTAGLSPAVAAEGSLNGSSTQLSANGLTASSTTNAAPTATGLDTIKAQAVALAELLQSQGTSAVNHVLDGFRGLLYTVVLRSLVTEIA